MNNKTEKYCSAIEDYVVKNSKKCFRESKGKLKYPFIVPGSAYKFELWDWDSWLTDLALSQALPKEDILEYEKGCVLNFLEAADKYGRIPIMISYKNVYSNLFDLVDGKETNIHKPCLAQHALFISKRCNSAEWLKDKFIVIENFVKYYEENCKHPCGLYYWIDDFAIGVDNEPCTFYRPNKSTGSIFLNSLMYSELKAVCELAKMLNMPKKADKYKKKSDELKKAIQNECWDERDGFYYSADLNLRPVNKKEWLHKEIGRAHV